MFTTTGAPGGFAIVAGRLVLVLPPDIPAERIEGLWRVVRASGAEGPLLEDVLTELTRHGLANLPDFVLAEVDGAGGATVAVRGDAVALSEGSRARSILGAEVDTWIETTLHGVSSLTLRLGADAPSAGDQWTPLERGIASAREVAWGRPAWFEIDERDDADSRDDVQASDPDPETPEELTIMSRRVRRSGHESIDGHTVLRSPKRVANWILRFASGQVIGVAGRVVVGRAPRPTEGTPPGVEQVEQLLSLRREVSANHALLIPEEDGVRVVDLHSTNGTVVRPRDGSSVLLTNGADALLEAGDRVNFGDDNIAVCERAPLHNP